MNLLANPSFQKKLAGWVTDMPSATTAVGVNIAPEWSVKHGTTAYLHADAPHESPSLSQTVAVAADSTATHWRISGYFASHRADVVVRVVFSDVAGATTGGEEFVLPERPDRAGGPSLSGYQFAAFYPQVPAGSRSVEISIRLGDHGRGESNRYAFINHLCLTPDVNPSLGGLPWLPQDAEPFAASTRRRLLRLRKRLGRARRRVHRAQADRQRRSLATRSYRELMATNPATAHTGLGWVALDQALSAHGRRQARALKSSLTHFDAAHGTGRARPADVDVHSLGVDAAAEAAFHAFTENPAEADARLLNNVLQASSYNSFAEVRDTLNARSASELPPTGVAGISGASLVVWHLADHDADLTVSFDGSPIHAPASAERSMVGTIRYARLPLPDAILDGEPHDLELLDAATGRPLWQSSEAGSIAVEIEAVGDRKIRGLVTSAAAHPWPPSLTVSVDGRLQAALISLERRRDLEGPRDRARRVWTFESEMDEAPGAASVEIGLAGSEARLPGGRVHTLSQGDAVDAVRSLARTLDSVTMPEASRAWLRERALPSLLDVTRGKAVSQRDHHTGGIVQPSPAGHASMQPRIDPTVDVVVPIYRDIAATRTCLEALLSARVSQPFHIVAINDASPEPDLAAWLTSFCAENDIELLVHADNQGFVATANHGMGLHPERDVVLLNSDAVVSDGWLDELRSGAYSEQAVASVTPISNNATVFSYPVADVEQDIPADVTRATLADMAREANAGEFVRIPTCHGFCVYLRRPALDAVGAFDQKTFTKGYGEETDWSQRAGDQGWTHLAAPGVFVEHLGSRSFQGDRTALQERSYEVIRTRYPEYDPRVQAFLLADPLARYRRRIDLARIKTAGDTFTLHLSHHLGGGTEKHVRDLTETYADGIRSLVLRPDTRRPYRKVRLTCPGLELEAAYDAEDEFDELVADLKDLGVERGHLHHLIGFTPDLPKRLLDALGAPYVATIHDYSATCPRIFLCRPEGDYCRGPRPEAECEACIATHGPLDVAEPLFLRMGNTYGGWLAGWESVLLGATELRFPTRSGLERFATRFSHPRMVVVPHPEPVFPKAGTPNSGKSRYTVALLGGLSWEKGLGRLVELADAARHAPLDFVVIGSTADDSALARFSHVRVHGSYQPDDVQSALAIYQPDVALFLSVWPETWSYTLSEAMTAGLPVVAPALGAFQDRLDGQPGCALFDPHAPATEVLATLLDFLRPGTGAAARLASRVDSTP